MEIAGYPMAKNLRAKIPEEDTMTVFDVNPSSSEKLTKEAVPANIQIAKGPREVAQNSVSKSCLTYCHSDEPVCSIYDLHRGLPRVVLYRDSSLLKPIL